MADPVEKERVSAKVKPPETATCYEDDLYTWVQEQVAMLRAGRFDELDTQNVAEELADVGRAQYDKLESALKVILLHMLRWDRQPGRRSRSWDNSIYEHRKRVERELHNNPGLKPRVAEALEEAYESARAAASTQTGLDRDSFPEDCPYDWNEVMSREFRWGSPATGRR
jgi:hypothetical protein